MSELPICNRKIAFRISHLTVDSVIVQTDSMSEAIRIANESFKRCNVERSVRIEIEEVMQ